MKNSNRDNVNNFLPTGDGSDSTAPAAAAIIENGGASSVGGIKAEGKADGVGGESAVASADVHNGSSGDGAVDSVSISSSAGAGVSGAAAAAAAGVAIAAGLARVSAVALASACRRSVELAGEEERKLYRLVAQLIQAQLKKVELKLALLEQHERFNRILTHTAAQRTNNNNNSILSDHTNRIEEARLPVD